MTKHSLFSFTELSTASLTAGQPFDALAPLEDAPDMHGRGVTIQASELQTYLTNTLAAIEATRGANGELAGLPIDARDHDKGDSGGWIVGAMIENGLIRFVPKWTELGIELISKGLRRFFSATIDLSNKVILGGSLTSWPATRNAKGQVLLRPIELSAGTMFELEESLDDQSMKVRRAFYEAMGSPDAAPPMAHEIYSDYIIVCVGDTYYKVTYTEVDGAVTFAPRAEWVQVEETYTEVNNAAAPEAPAALSFTEEFMTVYKDMDEAARNDFVRRFAEAQAKAPPPPTPGKTVELSADIAELVEQGKQFKTLQAELTQMKRETAAAQIAELCQRVTGGTQDAPRGLKGVTTAGLQKHLLALPADERQWFGELLLSITKNGLVEFGEVGHGRTVTGQVELPQEIKAKLDAGTFKLADLSNPILGLGDLKQYNLSVYQK